MASQQAPSAPLPPEDARAESKPLPTGWRRPAMIVVAAIGAGAMAAVAGPLLDVDVYWHTRLGTELLNGTSIYQAGHNWSFAPVPDNWVSTQWLVETLFAWLHMLWGWNGLIGFRVVTTGIAIATLAYAVFRGTRVWAAMAAFVLGVFAIVIFAQERPQQISFILLPLVGLIWLRAANEGRVPRWWWMLLLAAVWANCHGLWVMLPVALGLASIGRLMDHGRSDKAARSLGIATLAAVIGGCITPIGPLNLLIPFQFAGATDQILEWDPTNMLAISSLGLTFAAALMFWAWARGRTRPARGEILYGLLIVALGASAGRNVTPAVLMIAPLLAWRLTVAFRGPKPRLAPPGLVAISGFAAVIVVVAGVGFALVTMAASDPIPPGTQPTGLVSAIAARPGGARVLNNYNISGLTLWYTRPGASPSDGTVQVGVDGRADRYGGAYISRYLDMQRGRPGWEATLNELKPNVALLSEKDPLIDLLKTRGWQVTGSEAHYVMLEPGRSS